MREISGSEDSGSAATAGAIRPRKRLEGLDAARGLALIGLTAVHFLPAENDETHGPTLSWVLFAGDSAALFALLARVGLAFSTGGPRPRAGRGMAAARVGIAVRALLVAGLGLLINSLILEDPPAFNILLYYGVFFLLAIPFLRLRVRTLFLCAGIFAVVAPVLMLELRNVLPEFASYNPALVDVVTDPGATLAQLLLTGTYPALPYMTYLCAGLGLGRLDLHSLQVQARVLAAGVGVAVMAKLLSWILLYGVDGYHRLTRSTGLSEESLDNILIWGPDDGLASSSWWWLTITTPHTNTPLAIAWSLGAGVVAVGAFLLVSHRAGRWLVPLAAMGAMTLTLYSTQLVLLIPELHYDRPALWFVVYIVAAVHFALLWRRHIGQGPLERIVGTAAKSAGAAVLRRPAPPGGGSRDISEHRPHEGPGRK